jgi:6-phosphogluconolactonase (cycloisomerase 2 family)
MLLGTGINIGSGIIFAPNAGGGIAPPPTPTYSVTPGAGSINEGSSLTFNVTGSNITDGTYYWAINNATTSTADFGTNSGSFTITSNSGSFTVTPTADSLTEGSETFTVSVLTGSVSGTVVATSTSVTVNDTSTTPAPTYTATPTANNVNEGSSLTINVSGSGITDGTYYWTINNATTSTSDFGTNSGSFTITSNSGSFTVTPTADNLTEGAETFTVQIRTGSTSGTVVATTSTITVNDTSTTPASYTVTPTANNVNEGSSLTINVTGSNITDGTYYWTINNTTTSTADFGTNSGSFTITANSGSFTVTPTADSTTEGSETFTVSVRTGSTSGTVVATSSSITVNDTSTTPAASYSVAAAGAATSVNEGSSLTFNVTGSNITDGTYYWTINNVTTSSADFSAVSGSFTITSNSGSFTVTPTADSLTEGAETFTVSIRTGSTSGTVVATSSSITVNDTSTTPAPTYTATPTANNVNEGSNLTVNVTGTNITNGTYYWTINNGTTTSADFGTNSGSFTITSNAGSFTVTPTADSTTEGAETFTVQIRTGSTSGTVVATTSTITVNDTSTTPAPSYGVAAAGSATSVNEGSSLTFNVTGSNITDGTYYWIINNGTTTTADFGTNSGSFTITSNSGSFSVTPTADSTTEGAETFTVSVLTGSVSGTVVATSSSITVNDTSTAPSSTYTITSSSSVGELGPPLRVNISGSNITDGTYYWTINNGTTSTADFSASSGSFTIASNFGSFDITATADLTTEGPETFTIEIRTGSTSGPVVATSSSITVNDTSTTPTYSATPAADNVNEGSSLTINVSGTGIPDGTYYWSINNITTNSADFGGATSGAFTITSNSGAFNVSPVSDLTAEGSETFTVSIRTGSVSGTVVATTSTITVNDTSTTPATAPTSITLAVGSSSPVGGVTNVAIPAANGTDITGAITGWVASTACNIKFTVVNGGSATSTITINGGAYTSGSNYTVTSISNLSIAVTTSESGKTTVTRTFTIAVAAYVNPNIQWLVVGGGYPTTSATVYAINSGILASSASTIYSSFASSSYHFDGITVSPANDFIYFPNGTKNWIDVIPVNPATGIYTGSGASTASLTSGQSFPAKMRISPDGKHAYVTSNNTSGYNRLSIYTRNTSTGALTGVSATVGYGGMVLTSTGSHLYVSSIGSQGYGLISYSRDSSTGALTQVNLDTQYVNSGYVNNFSIAISSDNNSIFVADAAAYCLYVYLRDSTTGAATLVQTISTGYQTNQAQSVAVSKDGKHVYVGLYNITQTTGPTVKMYTRSASSPYTLTLTNTYTTGSGGDQCAGFALSKNQDLLVWSGTSNLIHSWSRNTSTGALTLNSDVTGLGAATVFNN